MPDDNQEPIEDYYDPMAGMYHLLFGDWRETVRQEGKILDRLIRGHTARLPQTVLDCACGIGTQAIGLALHGYSVHATDLSAPAVARARKEAQSFGVSLTWGVADLRGLESQVPGSYDLALALDNALPHLKTPGELVQALRGILARLEPGGLLFASMRDYDRAVDLKPRFLHERIYDDGNRIIFQIWDWQDDGRSYTVHQFILQKQPGEQEGHWKTSCFTGEYRALLREELAEAAAAAGFSDIHWYAPGESGYYQHLLIARKP